jgi:Zn-dependent protease
MFGRKIKLLTILGFDIKIDISWLIIAGLISFSLAGSVFPAYAEGQSEITYWIMGVLGALGLFASVTFHELSHSLAARKFGLPIGGITLFLFGGVSEMEHEPESPGVEFYMALAGPVSSIAAGVIFLAVSRAGSGAGWPLPVQVVIRYLGVINLLLAGFNLIPAFPLDGGRILRAALWKIKKDLHGATVISARAGIVFGFILIFLGVYSLFLRSAVGGVWWILVGLFLRSTSKRSIAQSRLKEAFRGVELAAIMNEDPVAVPADSSIEEIERYGEETGQEILPVVDEGRLTGCVDRKKIKEQAAADEETTAGDLAVPCPEERTARPDEEAAGLLHRLARNDWKGMILTVDDGLLKGSVSIDEIQKFLSLREGPESGMADNYLSR